MRNVMAQRRKGAESLICVFALLLMGLQAPASEKAPEYTFRNHVQPILAKMGCSAGACHGAAAGQNGFKLSLRGYDDDGDYLSLTRHAIGRRIIPSDPARSLMLLKPTGAVPHKGGTRFDTNSLEYQILADWIASGAPGPKPDDPRIEHIEVSPKQVALKPSDSQQFSVRAFFNDGHSEDVTRWAKFSAANGSVTQIDDNGKVQVVGHGEGAITAWYLSRIDFATVTVPYTNEVPKETFAKAPRRNFIDELVIEKLQTLNLPPSARCSDEEFIRRAFLDTIGTLPTAQEVRDFLSSKSERKRDGLIESLLKRAEFVDYWAYKWSDLLLVQSKQLKAAAMWSYYNWIRNNVAANTPWDKLVRELVTAQGSTLENGAANFYVLHDDARLLAENTTQAFLGMSINCAKCHNHPMEKWTNDEYYEFANLFARVRTKSGTGDGDFVIFAASSGDLVQPLRGKPQPPRPLEGKKLSMDSPEDRRLHLAQWLVSADNAYFSRSIVNRVWANFFGVGLVEAVDDMRKTNPASNEKLLAATAKFLVEQKFDLKALMRTILQSETYERSSVALAGNAADTRFYARYYPRRMMAEVLLDALSHASGAPTKFKNYPDGWRALQLPDSNVDSYFLKAFGRPEREKTCECERTDEPSVTQVLHISNGDTLNQKLTAKDNRIDKLLKDKAAPEKIIEEAYLNALARYPTDAEKEAFRKEFKNTKDSELRPLIEDTFWAILSSKEFLFNH
jgi:uncharacterized protein DUF1549/uncharacterized protein DUF1553/Big-like domain-containing protein